MQDMTVPPNRDQLVSNSSELDRTEQYDITKTWFEGQYDPSANTIIQTPPDDDTLSNI